MEAAIDYFATPPSDRKGLQEAKVILGDRELRSSMPVILGPHPELVHESRIEAQKRFETLLIELTGGNFQESDGTVDREHIRRLAHAGAGLRSALAKMRDAELRILFETDPVVRLWNRLGEKFDAWLGLPPAAG